MTQSLFFAILLTLIVSSSAVKPMSEQHLTFLLLLFYMPLQPIRVCGTTRIGGWH